MEKEYYVIVNKKFKDKVTKKDVSKNYMFKTKDLRHRAKLHLESMARKFGGQITYFGAMNNNRGKIKVKKYED